MLSARHLTCIRGDRPLFEGVGFSLSAGQWAHVRGGNGVGKTSLLRILAGLSPAAEGEILWGGEPIGSEAFRRELMYLGHQPAVKEDLSALENLQLAAGLDGDVLEVADAERALRRFGLAGREDLPVRFLSAGQKRRVLLARTLTRKAKLWILDEPFTALDVNAVQMLAGIVRDHLAAGGMAVLTSHQEIPLEAAVVVDLSLHGAQPVARPVAQMQAVQA
ncbi:cytochrome c biogenesis heme-transporting ATPase CcmA [Ramlibacter albus]|uniref:Cytochrome c biogenesis heme-transporting ATPase CcmA n=1 Tax=Ramlibacter albus TaxID=2079448 RepID=A0A923M7T6_9BURK|nr:cytochrome c biogenesis heme-transporting ATPase CcmA [Ramlibacter albus]MBC5764473.1 cytochrome c biogenesis heme-transporting ATPase CcmA [Ramlibacter albus]